ncbi:unnamed protein product [Dovyalis caffra]|uniref:Uncharacterized protein n=1 Tax=Dovyalis caffra TaxID=77055 RepID=A0AAV1S4B7_9ROSI|nr:unnamed protein product [Dovyalis caffra]
MARLSACHIAVWESKSCSLQSLHDFRFTRSRPNSHYAASKTVPIEEHCRTPHKGHGAQNQHESLHLQS